METTKKTIIEVQTSNGERVELGETVCFSCGGKTMVGIFMGIDKRGNWKFDGIKAFKNIHYTVAPRSIEEMYIAEVDCEGEEKLPFED